MRTTLRLRAPGRSASAICVATLLILALPQVSLGEELQTLDAVLACVQSNVPKHTSVQTVEFVARDKVGYEKTTRAKIYAKRGEDALRRVLTLFTKPIDVRGAQYLMLENKPTADLFVYTPELRKTKRISGRAAAGSLFGTDFSFEDFERLQHINRPGESQLLPSETVMDRPVYVVENTPAEEAGSAYEAVVSYFDKKTCVAVKTESFEKGRRLRKRLVADPDQISEDGGVYIAHQVTMEDVRDNTTTRLVVESIEVGVPIKDRTFRLSQLGKNLH